MIRFTPATMRYHTFLHLWCNTFPCIYNTVGIAKLSGCVLFARSHLGVRWDLSRAPTLYLWTSTNVGSPTRCTALWRIWMTTWCPDKVWCHALLVRPLHRVFTRLSSGSILKQFLGHHLWSKWLNRCGKPSLSGFKWDAIHWDCFTFVFTNHLITKMHSCLVLLLRYSDTKMPISASCLALTTLLIFHSTWCRKVHSS